VEELSAKINGRRIQGSTFDGEWRWFVGTTGPAWQGIHLYVWVFAGNTVEEARSLATPLGQLPDAEDETAKVTWAPKGANTQIVKDGFAASPKVGSLGPIRDISSL
jgi:hypothetical protein